MPRQRVSSQPAFTGVCSSMWPVASPLTELNELWPHFCRNALPGCERISGAHRAHLTTHLADRGARDASMAEHGRDGCEEGKEGGGGMHLDESAALPVVWE